MIATWAATAALRASLGRGLARIPAWAWIALCVALAAFLAWRWHGGEVRAADQAGYNRAMAEIRTKAERVTRLANDATKRATDLQQAINTEERNRHEAQARHIAADAAALRRMRPSGALRCGPADPAPVPGIPGRPAAPGGRADAPLVAVDWKWLIDRAEQADLNRAEALTWRSWYERQRDAYEQWRRDWIKAGEEARVKR